MTIERRESMGVTGWIVALFLLAALAAPFVLRAIAVHEVELIDGLNLR